MFRLFDFYTISISFNVITSREFLQFVLIGFCGNSLKSIETQKLSSMYNLPLISIVVPVYNVADYLEECIDSIRQQTYKNLEIIIVDDGSTDKSGEICDGYSQQDNRIKIIHQKNSGLSAARNTGIDTATGEFLFFIDSDDIIHHKCIETLYINLYNNNADISSAELQRFKTIDNFSDKVVDGQLFLSDGEECCRKILYQKTLDNSACAKLFKRQLFSNTRFPLGTLYEDLALIPIIYLNATRAVHQSVSLYFYRQRENSIIETFTMKRTDVLNITDNLVDLMALSHPQLLPAAKSRKFSANMNILYLMNSNGIKNQDIIDRCWQNIKNLRLNCLFDPNVRSKNKIGALASFAGKRILSLLFRFFKT